MKNHLDSRDRLFEQAMGWVTAFRDETGDRAALFSWLAESPRHVEELSFALALSEEIAGLTPRQREEIEAMAARAGEVPVDMKVVALQDAGIPAAQPASKVSVMRRLTWAGVMAAGLGIVAFGMVRWNSTTYSTGIGELRTLQLQDGSLVHLDARSRLEVRFTENAREMQLIEGEALFDVKPDPVRPFRVHADETVIQALGTQFSVHKRPSGTVVSVLEGSVRVTEQVSDDPAASANSGVETLKAGEEVQVERSGRMKKRKHVELTTMATWQQRRMVFKGDTLADIAAEFNRYNVRPQIRIVDEEVRSRHFAGTFDANAPQALVEALRVDESLDIASTEDEIVVRKR